MMFYDSTPYTEAVYVLDRTLRSQRGGKRMWNLRCEAYSNIIGQAFAKIWYGTELQLWVECVKGPEGQYE